MSDPSRFLPGTSWFVTSRCNEGRYFMVPTRRVTELITYCLAESAEQYGIRLHSATFMSTHYHAVVTDTRGVLPDFLQTFHRTLAQALNREHGRFGSVFARNNVLYEELVGEAAFVSAMAYVASNPVSAFAVAYGREWPGLRTHAKEIGRAAVFTLRPGHFLKHRSGEYRGRLPEKARLQWELPPCVEPERRGAFIAALERAIGAREADARAEAESKGARFMGAPACRRMSPDARAPAPERRAPGTGPSRIFADDDVTRKVLEAERQGFLDAYKCARLAWEAGDRMVLFPSGTWLIVRRHKARCHPPPV